MSQSLYLLTLLLTCFPLHNYFFNYLSRPALCEAKFALFAITFKSVSSATLFNFAWVCRVLIFFFSAFPVLCYAWMICLSWNDYFLQKLILCQVRSCCLDSYAWLNWHFDIWSTCSRVSDSSHKDSNPISICSFTLWWQQVGLLWQTNQGIKKLYNNFFSNKYYAWHILVNVDENCMRNFLVLLQERLILWRYPAALWPKRCPSCVS